MKVFILKSRAEAYFPEFSDCGITAGVREARDQIDIRKWGLTPNAVSCLTI